MNVAEVIAVFCDNPESDPERDKYANELFEESLKVTMELSNRHYTLEE